MNAYEVSYEWSMEETEYWLEHGEEVDDIVDQRFSDSVSDFIAVVRTDSKRYRLVLVRTVGNNVEGIVDRAWAYCVEVNGRMELPETFDNGKAVPKKYKKELERAQVC